MSYDMRENNTNLDLRNQKSINLSFGTCLCLSSSPHFSVLRPFQPRRDECILPDTKARHKLMACANANSTRFILKNLRCTNSFRDAWFMSRNHHFYVCLPGDCETLVEIVIPYQKKCFASWRKGTEKHSLTNWTELRIISVCWHKY